MICKLLEIRDSGTFIPALAIQLEPTNEADRFLFARAGYGRDPADQLSYVLLAKIDGGERTGISYDPYHWDTRTMREAHKWLLSHFDELESGAVVDVQFLLGETAAPKQSEAVMEY